MWAKHLEWNSGQDQGQWYNISVHSSPVNCFCELSAGGGRDSIENQIRETSDHYMPRWYNFSYGF